MSPSEAVECIRVYGEHYVTRAAWSRPVGRPELIDEVADASERPETTAAATTAAPQPVPARAA